METKEIYSSTCYLADFHNKPANIRFFLLLGKKDENESTENLGRWIGGCIVKDFYD